MGILTVMEKGACPSELIELPLFYMNDFSMLGLQVPRLAPAIQALEARGFEIESGHTTFRIRFEGAGQMARIFQILRSENVSFDMTDLMGQAYQG